MAIFTWLADDTIALAAKVAGAVFLLGVVTQVDWRLFPPIKFKPCPASRPIINLG